MTARKPKSEWRVRQGTTLVGPNTKPCAVCGKAKASVFEFIEVFYNRQRLHSTLGYCPACSYSAGHYLAWRKKRACNGT